MISITSQVGTLSPYSHADYCIIDDSVTTFHDPIKDLIVKIQFKNIMDQPLTPVDTIYILSEEEGGFVAFSEEFEGAAGQGDTLDECLQDIENAIVALKEFYMENPDW